MGMRLSKTVGSLGSYLGEASYKFEFRTFMFLYKFNKYRLLHIKANNKVNTTCETNERLDLLHDD